MMGLSVVSDHSLSVANQLLAVLSDPTQARALLDEIATPHQALTEAKFAAEKLASANQERLSKIVETERAANARARELDAEAKALAHQKVRVAKPQPRWRPKTRNWPNVRPHLRSASLSMKAK